MLSDCVAQRYGACAASCSAVSELAPAPFTMIFAFAISDSNTGAPLFWFDASITMNGFIADHRHRVGALRRLVGSRGFDELEAQACGPSVWYVP